MRTRITVGIVFTIALFGVGTFASRAGEQAGRRQWSIVNFVDPVQVQHRIVMGPVLIVHDDAKMAKGEPCTTFYRFDTAAGPQEQIVAFHCRPDRREVVDKTTFTYAPGSDASCKKLVEYQIAGDAESHGIPER
jgi:hypothetical protein